MCWCNPAAVRSQKPSGESGFVIVVKFNNAFSPVKKYAGEFLLQKVSI